MSSNFFVHITDLHLTSQNKAGWEALERFVQQVRAMDPQPAFVVNTGDIVFASMQIESEPETVREDFEKYYQTMSQLPIPLYNAIGNHDMTRSTGVAGTGDYGKELFVKYCGPRFRSFGWNGWHGVVLDQWAIKKKPKKEDVDQSLILESYFDDEQLAWLKDDLSSCASGQNVLIFLHHRLPDYAETWNKLKSVLRDDLTYYEIAGCDHQSSQWRQGNWNSHTAGSFCGGWWNGECLDRTEGGYAIMVADELCGLKQYYRAIDHDIAIASPKPGQVVENIVDVDAFDPETGRFARYEIDISRKSCGWTEVKIQVDGKHQSVKVFRFSDKAACLREQTDVFFEFDLVDAVSDFVEIKCNGSIVGILEFEKQAARTCRLMLPAGNVYDWNSVELVGKVLIRSPRLIADGKAVFDSRILWLESVRPEWFEEGKILIWDTSCAMPPTPMRIQGNTFYFYLGE